MFDLHGKRALITGSTQGIGLAIAKLFAERGADVIVHGSSSIEKCEKAMAETGACMYVCQDMTKADCAEAMYEKRERWIF